MLKSTKRLLTFAFIALIIVLTATKKKGGFIMATTSVLLKSEDRATIDKFAAFIKSLNNDEKNSMLYFIEGANFTKNLYGTEKTREILINAKPVGNTS